MATKGFDVTKVEQCLSKVNEAITDKSNVIFEPVQNLVDTDIDVLIIPLIDL